jgi:hypothetical protein
VGRIPTKRRPSPRNSPGAMGTHAIRNLVRLAGCLRLALRVDAAMRSSIARHHAADKGLARLFVCVFCAGL